MFKVNNKDRKNDVFYVVLLSSLLTLNKYLFTGRDKNQIKLKVEHQQHQIYWKFLFAKFQKNPKHFI